MQFFPEAWRLPDAHGSAGNSLMGLILDGEMDFDRGNLAVRTNPFFFRQEPPHPVDVYDAIGFDEVKQYALQQSLSEIGSRYPAAEEDMPAYGCMSPSR